MLAGLLEGLVEVGLGVADIGIEDVGDGDVEEARSHLPGDGAGYYQGVSYYTLDAQATLELINSYFNPYTQALTLDDMDILVP